MTINYHLNSLVAYVQFFLILEAKIINSTVRNTHLHGHAPRKIVHSGYKKLSRARCDSYGDKQLKMSIKQ